MADEVINPRGFVAYLRKFWDEAILRSTVNTLTQTAETEVKQGLQRLRVKIFGWSNSDERISLEDQTLLGPEAVKRLNLWLESLDDYWTYRLRIIVSGIEDQSKRLDIYKMILNAEPDERKRQLEQVCQTPEYLSKAWDWLMDRYHQIKDDREARNFINSVTRGAATEIHREVPGMSIGEIEASLWERITSGPAEQWRRFDGQCERLARQLRQVNQETAHRRQNPRGFWRWFIDFFSGR